MTVSTFKEDINFKRKCNIVRDVAMMLHLQRSVIY